jgi:uncharacterized protein YbjT (DUF2867 family)
MNRNLVIGSTGNIGRQVVDGLWASGANVRAMTRNPESARFPPEVEVVRGDLAQPETLESCLDGIDSVFLVWTAAPDTVAPAIERIARHARRIVFLSSPYKTQHPFFQQPNKVRGLHAGIEQCIEASGLQWTFLRPGMLAVNAKSWWLPQVRAGNTVRWPCLAAPTAPIHEKDIAAVAVRVLSEEGHAGTEYVLTGPQSLTQAEQVREIGRAIGRTLQTEELTPEEARRELRPIMPPFIIEMLLDAWNAALGQPAFVTSTVTHITGAPARTVHDWALDHAAAFQGAG